MKKEIHRIIPDVQRRIAAIAKELPPTAETKNGEYVYKPVTVKGSHPQLNGQVLKDGTPLDPSAMYRINELQYVNHHKAMCDLFKRDGWQGVEDYQTAIQSQFDHFVAKAAMNTASKKWYNRLGRFLISIFTKHEK